MDDVHYLRKHASEESFLFVVDSARRDTAVYPEPHEYEVAFNAPFRNVVGLDLIDATLPRTEYLVERGANTLVLDAGHGKTTVAVPPADYNILQLVEALNAALATAVAPATVLVRPSTTPAELGNRVRLLADRPCVVHAAESGLRRALGLGHHAPTLSTADVVPGALGPVTAQGPLPASDTLALDLPCRQALAFAGAGRVTAVRAYAGSDAPGAVVRAAVLDAEGGGLLAEGYATTTGADFEQLTIPLQAVEPLRAGAGCFLVLQGESARVYTGPEPPSQALAPPDAGEPWWEPPGWTDGDGQVCASVDAELDGYVLEPPGVVDLTGEPYVLVRCPEIEQCLYRDRAYEAVHAGMGLVKLGNYGFREQRFDFVSFPPRRLPTPLGKLPKLTIRLEKGDGGLYDTKGVDHHLVFVVRYLEMTRGPECAPSTLNPAYQPNPLLYLQAQGRAPDQSHQPHQAHQSPRISLGMAHRAWHPPSTPRSSS